MNITVRAAGPLDCRPIAELLNEIIAEGGTTALTQPVSASDIKEQMAQAQGKSAWHLAEDETGMVMGFQWIQPAAYLPAEAAEIATFARRGRTGLGIGSALFRATEQAALTLGYTWINANIRADNTGGLAYYQSRGFEDYAIKRGVTLDDGRKVDKVLKRFNL